MNRVWIDNVIVCLIFYRFMTSKTRRVVLRLIDPFHSEKLSVGSMWFLLTQLKCLITNAFILFYRADASLYASLFPQVAGKQCVVYKAVMEESEDQFSAWLSSSTGEHGNSAFNLVGGASSSVAYAGEYFFSATFWVYSAFFFVWYITHYLLLQLFPPGPSLPRAAAIVRQRSPSSDFGCVCIAERHGKRDEVRDYCYERHNSCMM